MTAIPPDVLLRMYASGVFPMADGKDGEIYLYSPDPRTIILPEHFHVPDSLRRTWRSGRFEIRFNTCFDAVMRQCAARDETWISDDIIRSYVLLHERGAAHSVEAWRNGALVGGLYGVALGGAFFGESMFHIERDASKVALVALVEHMRVRGMTLLDVQYSTPHLRRFGAEDVPRARYLELLEEALGLEVSWGGSETLHD